MLKYPNKTIRRSAVIILATNYAFYCNKFTNNGETHNRSSF